MSSTHAHAGHGHDSHGDHVSSLGTYLTIYGVLIILTILTVAVSYMGLPGSMSIAAAMGVAVVKSFLVAGWFMHLKYDSKFNVLVFLSAFWFMACFFFFTLNDLSSRGNILQVNDNFGLRTEMGMKVARPATVVGHGSHGAEQPATEGGGEHH